MLNEEQKEQFNTILEELGKALDITKTEYEAAVQSYHAVAKQLTKPNSELKPYSPNILPQGSFMIGTIIKPVNEGDDLDIDLVCQLKGKRHDWTQEDVKRIVGKELSKNEVYNRLLERPDGRRCWTLRYREGGKDDEGKYHMDILPSIANYDYKIILESRFPRNDLGAINLEDIEQWGIRITDNERDDYCTEQDHLEWLKSNPYGYAKWFEDRTSIMQGGVIIPQNYLATYMHDVPSYREEKSPLQRVVQILKRHRDRFYIDRDDMDDKPISIIITTLAARAYRGEADILEALRNVVPQMLNYIEDHPKEVDNTGRVAKLITNPVNPEENFADKWMEHPKRRDNFYEWHKKLEEDLDRFFAQQGLGSLNESLSPFGNKIAEKVVTAMGDRMRIAREKGLLKASGLTGTLGNQGKKIDNHNFHGEEA